MGEAERLIDWAADNPRFRSEPSALCERRGVAPVLALVAVNVAAAAAAGLLLERARVLPPAVTVHAALMIVAWGCLLPLGGLVARYFKVTPNQDFPTVVDNPFWWNWHRILQYAGTALALVALIVILRWTGGRFQTVHGRLGIVVLALAGLQVASPLFRGSKGGPTEPDARPDEPGTWRGDHFDMTRRRRLFEAWHKPVGWSLLALSQITLLLGAILADAPDWLLCLLGSMSTTLVLSICDCHWRGRWVSTVQALWGRDARA